MKRITVTELVLCLSALTLCAVIAGGPTLQAGAVEQASPAAKTAPPTLNDTVRTYCVGCHNDKVRRGELSLASFDVTRAGEHAEDAEKMIRKLRLGMMPPKEASRKPDA